jgi:phosphatidylinositol alpha-1,6-mannosyltransferase
VADPAAVILTPNLAGRDGVSRLARLVAGAFPAPTVIALHEPVAMRQYERAAVRGSEGSQARFVATSLRAAATADAATTVSAVHLHLAPAALAFTARGASLAVVLCGVEAWKPLSWMQRAALERADRLVAISAHTRDRFFAANPAFAGRAVEVCHLGIEDLALRAAARDGAPSALIVGRMAADERYKGHDELLDVWPDVVAAIPGATLRIVGDGDDRGRLEALAAALGLGSQVTFLGSLDDEQLRLEYERCSLFAMPSRDEGFGFVFVEAMRAARACIAARGAAAEIVDEGETGLLVEPRDRGGLLDALVRLLGDREYADRLGRAGRARFTRDFTDRRFRERFSAAVDARVAVLVN